MKKKENKQKVNDKIIVASDKFPFFNEYHEDRYIKCHDCRSIISLEDKGSTNYRMEKTTPFETVVYYIDGKLIDDDSYKCDFGIYTEKDELYLVELKGTDYDHACEQISSTINRLVKQPQIPVQSIHARIVLTHRPHPRTKHNNERLLHQKLNKYQTSTEKIWDINVYNETIYFYHAIQKIRRNLR